MTEGYDKDLNRLKHLTSELHKASVAYYQDDKPFMSDKNYDDLYDELEALENKMGISLAGSPTQKVQGFVLDGFKKVTHSKPMLSAAKTKDPAEIKKFLKDNKWYCSFKLDGLTLVVKYKNGKFIQGITRGNGTIGEDVTEACRFIQNLPMKINNTDDIEVRGECVISWEEFKRINSELEEPYSHPRNLAAGTLRNLDLNIVRDRKLSFIPFELVSPEIESKWEGMRYLDNLGFSTVQRIMGVTVDQAVETMNPEKYEYPCDGLIFELNSFKISKATGATAHHESCRMALKWKDDMYETKLENIEWSVSKSGLLNPVAVFSPVDLDGAITTRATLHNITYIKNLKLGIGDRIHVYRSNMVIPRVHDSINKSDNITIPSVCPVCGGETKIVKENDSKVLICTNPDCQGKLLYKLSHFASRNALNIEGLSESTIQFLLKRKWVSCFKDLYHLKGHEAEWKRFPGFGTKSVTGILAAIEKSRETTLDRFLYGLSIPMVGRSASEMIAKACDYDFGAFMQIMVLTGAKFFNYLDGVGDSIIKSMDEYFNKECSNIFELSKEFNFNVPKVVNLSLSSEVSGKTFVITGSVEHFANRDAVKDAIVNHGGKVVGSVSAKVDYLVNNDINSTSSKNKKAKELGIKIITENELIKMLGD